MGETLLNSDNDKLQMYQKYKSLFKSSGVLTRNVMSAYNIVAVQYTFPKDYGANFGNTVRTSRYGFVHIPAYFEQYMNLAYKIDINTYDSMISDWVRNRGILCGVKKGKSIEVSLSGRSTKVSFDKSVLKADGTLYYENALLDMQAIGRIIAYARIGAYIDTDVLNGISSWGTMDNPIIIKDDVFPGVWVRLYKETIIGYMLGKCS